MKILAITNLYPPHIIGGYEIGCQAVLERLKKRGHEVYILTSDYKERHREWKNGISRALVMDLFYPANFLKKALHALCKENNNRREIRRALAEIKPDIVYVWNNGSLSISALSVLSDVKVPVAMAVADYWLLSWRQDNWLNFLRKLRIPHRENLTISAGNLHFPSAHLMRKTLDVVPYKGESEVVYWGIDPDQFTFHQERKSTGKILYVGQLVEHKGVHIAIEALHEIRKNPDFQFCTLTIVGGTVRPEYEERIRSLVNSLGLENHVHFLGSIPRSQLPEIYAQHDIQIFPSLWEEPLGLTLLEGMATGLAMAATGSGGSAEALRHEQNALLYSKEDPKSCAEAVMRLIRDKDLHEKLRRAARKDVETVFNISEMTAKSEAALNKVLNRDKKL